MESAWNCDECRSNDAPPGALKGKEYTMMKHVYILIAGFGVLVVQTSCSSNDPIEENPQLNVDPISCSLCKTTNTDRLVISNDGGGELTWEITEKPDWIGVLPPSGNVTNNKDAVEITADIEVEPGTYSGNIRISSNGGDADITVTLDISTWIRKADMLDDRAGLSANAVNGKIYVIGGQTSTDSKIFRSALEYDPVSDVWSRKAGMQFPRQLHCSAVVDGIIYVFGGDGVQQTEAYAPDEDSWTKKADMPAPGRGTHACAAVNGKIYIIGGTHGPDWPALRIVDEYDPATDTWTRKTPMPTGRWNIATTVVGGIVYAMGGHKIPHEESPGLSTVEAYDPAGDTWTNVKSMPTRRTGLRAIAVNGIVYAIGGGPGMDALPINEAYDPSSDTWNRKTGMLAARWMFGVAALNGRVYVMGGTVGYGQPSLRTVEEYTPAP